MKYDTVYHALPSGGVKEGTYGNGYQILRIAHNYLRISRHSSSWFGALTPVCCGDYTTVHIICRPLSKSSTCNTQQLSDISLLFEKYTLPTLVSLDAQQPSDRLGRRGTPNAGTHASPAG